MRVLALDIATKTGVAVGVSSAAPRAWTVDFGGSSQGRRFSEMISFTSEVLAKHKPDVVAIEAPIGGKKKNPVLIGLAACAEGVCHLRRVPCHMVRLDHVRVHFLGKNLTKRHFPGFTEDRARKAIKATVVARCEAIGWAPDNDDEADAMAVWSFACTQFVAGHQAAPLGGLYGGRRG
ncbi:MAG: hypothetical protein AAFQ58_19150 [Pseudomonadota bacterium]